MPERTIIYVDGYNLYYGALKDSPHKWLDLQRYFSLLRAQDDLRKIKYFTAKVTNEPSATRQTTYLNALESCSKVQVIFGKYAKQRQGCKVAACNYAGSRHFYLHQEKCTDVNIAVNMIADAIAGECDRMVLVSADSDLVPAILHVRNNYAPKITVYIPSRHHERGAAVEIRNAAHKNYTLPLNFLARAHFANPMTVDGTLLHKPVTWA